MRSLSLAIVALISLMPMCSSADEPMDKRLREAVSLPMVAISHGMGYSRTTGLVFHLEEHRTTETLIAEITKSLKGDDSDAERNLQLGYAYRGAKEPALSKAAFGRSIDQFSRRAAARPKDVDLQVSLAEARMPAGQLVEAEDTLRSAIKLAPRNWNALVTLATVLTYRSLSVLWPEPINGNEPDVLARLSIADDSNIDDIARRFQANWPDLARLNRAKELKDEADTLRQRVTSLAGKDSAAALRVWEGKTSALGLGVLLATVVQSDAESRATLPARWKQFLSIIGVTNASAGHYLVAAADREPENARLSAFALANMAPLVGVLPHLATLAQSPEFETELKKLPVFQGANLGRTLKKSLTDFRDDFDRLLKRLEKLTEHKDVKIAADAREGMSLVRAAQRDDAQSTLWARKALERDPGRNGCRAVVAASYLTTDQFGEAVRVLEAGLGVRDSAFLRVILTKASELDGKSDRAVEHLTAARRLDPKDPTAALMAAAYELRKPGQASLASASSLLDSVRKSIEGSWDQFLRKELEILTAALLGRRGDLKGALATVDKVLKGNEKHQNAERLRLALLDALSPDG